MSNETLDTLESNLEWAKMRRAGVVAMGEVVESIIQNNSIDPKSVEFDLRLVYAPAFDAKVAKREIDRLDWVVGLIEKDIRKAKKASK